MKRIITLLCALTFAVQYTACSSSNPQVKRSEDRTRILDAQAALDRLYELTPGARELGKSAAGILIFPEITKAGLLVGGQYGNGVLLKNGKAAGFYNSTAASYGLQAGVQQFGYALFLMSESDLKYLDKSEGWEIGVGPTITVVDKGMAGSLTTTTARKGVYVFFFEQKGLMAGIGIQGTKITKTDSVG